MADESATFTVASPIPAGTVIAPSGCSAVELRAGQNVVHVWVVATPVGYFTLFVQLSFFCEIVAVTVEVINVLSDSYAVVVVPRTRPDSVTSVFSVCACGAKVRTPGCSCCSSGTRKQAAVTVGTIETAKIRTVSGAHTRQEEAHIAGLRERRI